MNKLILTLIQDNTQSAYLNPTSQPLDFPFRDKGNWVYIDKTNLLSDKNIHYTENNILSKGNASLIEHRFKLETLPETKREVFNFVFYEHDYGMNHGKNSKPVLTTNAVQLLRIGGILLTKSSERETIATYAPELTHIGGYEAAGFDMYLKNK